MTHKHYISGELGFGHSFPDFNANDYWRGTFYPGFQTSAGYKLRLNRNWELNSKVGLSSYFLVNRSESGRYVFDFASPSFEIGSTYMHLKKSVDCLFGVNIGGQVGYLGGLITDIENDYTVDIDANKFFLFTRPEIGLRKSYSNLRQTFQHDFGVFFRYNFTRLGTVVFNGPDYVVSTSPNGHLIGVYYRFNMNIGTKMTRIKKHEEELPRL